jgi:hypothetical protein
MLVIQGCQMAYFQTKPSNLGIRILEGLGINFFITIWYSMWPFALLSCHLLYFVVICYIFLTLVFLLSKIWQPWESEQVKRFLKNWLRFFVGIDGEKLTVRSW